jgi:hypothetical protein
MAKLKAGRKEKLNHYVNNPRGTTVTPEMVLKQEKNITKQINLWAIFMVLL